MGKAIRAISTAGAVAGVLDISDAFTFYGVKGISPVRILQSISSGLLGRQAYQGGVGTAALGLLLHFIIAFSAAAIFYLASRRIAFLTRRPVLAGLLYGVFVYAFMNGVVLPLSAIGTHGPTHGWPLVNGVLAILLLVGLPISLIVRRLAPAQESAAPGAGPSVPDGQSGLSSAAGR